MKERPVTVAGTMAICHAWELDPKELRIDCSFWVKILNDKVTQLSMAGKPKLIIIKGKAGSGKSTLSKVLKANGSNVVLIDPFDIAPETYYQEPVQVGHLIADPQKTYLIDEAAYCEQATLSEALEQHTRAGGLTVLFVQSLRDLRININALVLEPKDHGSFGFFGRALSR